MLIICFNLNISSSQKSQGLHSGFFIFFIIYIRKKSKNYCITLNHLYFSFKGKNFVPRVVGISQIFVNVIPTGLN